MKSHEISIKKTITAQFISDIFDTAFEGGINYWCSEAKTTCGEDEDISLILSAVLTDNEAEEGDDPVPVLTQENAVEAISKIIDGSYACRNDIREAITKAILEDDGGNIDAEGADVIVQFAVFKELVYG